VERKIKLLIEYEGSAYHGWQFQRNGLSIQEVLEECIQKAVKQKATLHSWVEPTRGFMLKVWLLILLRLLK